MKSYQHYTYYAYIKQGINYENKCYPKASVKSKAQNKVLSSLLSPLQVEGPFYEMDWKFLSQLLFL